MINDAASRSGAVLSCLAGLIGLTLAPGARAASVVVEAIGIEAGAGQVYAALCSGGIEEGNCGLGQRAPAAIGLRFTFEKVAPGPYAVAVFQDLNGNERLDRSPLGLPLEPYGFSNEAGRGRKPTFEEAAVAVAEPSVTVQVRLARAGRGRP